MKAILTSILILSYLTGSYSINDLIQYDQIKTLYSPKESIEKAYTELAFWQKKLDASPNQTTYLLKIAHAQSLLFDLTGNVRYLKASERSLDTGLDRSVTDRSSFLRALAANLISQHRFCEALDQVLEAADRGDKMRLTNLMLFDIYSELGKTTEVEEQLRTIAEIKDFNYLIRYAKYEDSKGRLSAAIELLEDAAMSAEYSRNATLSQWAYSNIADFYGHNGEIEMANRYYTKALKINPSDWYSYKGLAWIAYAHDLNIDLANRILSDIAQYHFSPDIILFKAELSAYIGDIAKSDRLNDDFIDMVNTKEYGIMYQKHLASMFIDDPENSKMGIAMAYNEVEQRPTAASYDLLSWTLYHTGEQHKAKQIAQQFVLDKSEEPSILIHQLEIFKDHEDISYRLRKELRSATFEIGPLAVRMIEGD